jgi:photosystem II stability/assembly factor-like uncharacterized protein
MSSPTPDTATQAAPTLQSPKFNLSWGVMAIATFVAAITLSEWQPTYPYPAKPFAARSLIDQVIYPLESNGELRLWQPASALNSVAASSDGKYVLAVGNSGAALFSSNGGRQWQRLTTGVNEHLTYAWISDDGSQGGAVTFAGLKYQMSLNGGAWTLEKGTFSGKPAYTPPVNYVQQTSDPASQNRTPSLYFNNRSPDLPQGMPPGTQIERFISKDVSDKSNDVPVRLAVSSISQGCKQAWAVDDLGSIVTSLDCGKSWELQASALVGSLSTVTFLADGEHGWSAGYGGVLLRTTDGGDQWIPVPTDTATTLTSIMFLETGHGWVVGEDGTFMSSTDLGRSWVSKDIQPKRSGLRSVYFRPDGLRGWIAGNNDLFLATVDGGLTWTNVTLEKAGDIHNIRFSPDGLNGSATASMGMVVTNDGGETWKFQPNPVATFRFTQTASYNADAYSGWMALGEGNMYSTTDGWSTWQHSYSPARSRRMSMWFSSANEGWAVGLHPALTRTQDGGKTWSVAPSPIQYSRYPAPWFWASLILVVWMWVRAFHTKPPPVEEGVAAIAASDAPTQHFSQDRLGFGPLAKGISRFLRNEATEPPLTLAISGDWGTGKSSLMTLICKDLQSNGSRPVWFNAWHHQKDEQLLAALLSAVREQSLPSLLKPTGWLFRWRLLVLRMKKHWFVTSLLILAGVWLGAYLSAHEAGQWQSLWAVIEKTSTAIQQGSIPVFFESLNLGPFAAKLAGLATAFVALRKGLTAFGADPAVLLSNSVDQFRLKEANALTNFRSRFAKEFDEVTQCLPGRLVIVIDDLDRCRAESVLEVMEAVNFLVASGKCFIIFGMATNRVQAALALSFEKIAQEMTELDIATQSPLTAEAKAELERTRRRKYARDYLEKLINLEIAVPNTPADKPHSLLEDSPADSTRKTVLFKRLKVAVTAALCIGVLAYTWHLGQHFQFPIETTLAHEPAMKKQTDTTSASTESKGTNEDLSVADRTKNNPYPLTEAIDTRNHIVFSVVTVTLLVAAAGLTYALFRLRRNLYKVQDSPAFKASLAAWSPLVQRHRKTPRALKRFANRLRYLAMLHQAQRLDQSGWDALPKRLKEWLGLSITPEQPSTTQTSIAEHRIVALGALYEVFGSDWKNCAKACLPENELAGAAEESIRAYCAPGLGVTWPPSDEEIESFARSLAGVRIPS